MKREDRLVEIQEYEVTETEVKLVRVRKVSEGICSCCGDIDELGFDWLCGPCSILDHPSCDNCGEQYDNLAVYDAKYKGQEK